MRREDGIRLGEDEIVAHTDVDQEFDDLVAALVSRPTAEVVTGLGEAGVEYVVLPAPADPDVAAALDATGGLVAASAEDRDTRAWQVDRPLSAAALDGPRSWLRIACSSSRPWPWSRSWCCALPTRQPEASMSRFRADLALAVALPVVCVAALLVAHPPEGDRGDDVRHEPELTALTSASVVCPSTISPDGFVGVTTLTEATGEVLGGARRRRRPVQVEPSTGLGRSPRQRRAGGGHRRRRARTGPGRRPLGCHPVHRDGLPAADRRAVVHGPRLRGHPQLGHRAGQPQRGARGRRRRPLVAGRAAHVPELLGISVPGGDGVKIDLAALVPRRGELMAQVTTSRGRLAVDVADSVDELGTGLVASDWLSPQPAPATRNLLLGVARGTGDRILVLGNPGDDEVRVTVRIVTPRAVFAPAGLEPVTVAPGSTKPVTLTTLLDEAAEQGAIGLLVESTGPVATIAAPARRQGPVRGRARRRRWRRPRPSWCRPARPGCCSPTRRASGWPRWSPSTPRARSCRRRPSSCTPDTGASIALPAGTALVRLTPERTSVGAALLVTAAQGVAVVQLRGPLVEGLVPDVRPSLP